MPSRLPSAPRPPLDELLDPPDEPAPEEDVPPPVHALLWHVPPSVVQSVQATPEPPHTVSMVPVWQVPVESQHPEHVPQVLADPSSLADPPSPPSTREPLNPG
jgi:hypothetical protein